MFLTKPQNIETKTKRDDFGHRISVRTALEQPTVEVHHRAATEALHRLLNLEELLDPLVLANGLVDSVRNLANLLARLLHLAHGVIDLGLLLVLCEPDIAGVEGAGDLRELPVDVRLLELAVLLQELLQQHAVARDALNRLDQQRGQPLASELVGVVLLGLREPRHKPLVLFQLLQRPVRCVVIGEVLAICDSSPTTPVSSGASRVRCSAMQCGAAGARGCASGAYRG